MNARRATAPPAILALAAVCVACASPPPDPRHPDDPRRIVSLSPALTEILFALELGDRVVGVTSYCDWPPEARGKAKVGGYVNPSVETIVGLAPDLVLVSPNAGNRESALAVREAGIRLEVLPAETLAETFAAIDGVGRLCGVEARAAALSASLRDRLDAVEARVRGERPVRALFCLQLEPIIAAGAGTLPAEILAIAGGANVVEAERYPRLGIETIVAAAPEVILQSRMDDGDRSSDDETLFWSRWSTIPAVAAGRVHVVSADLMLRPGPRVVDGAERLARILHPDAAETGP